MNPPEEKNPLPPGCFYIKTDVSSWKDLSKAFKEAGPIDIAVANAAVAETVPFFSDELDEAGALKEPDGKLLDVNFRSVLYFVKLALHQMRGSKGGGSIVITASATAYAPEQSLPAYSATKNAVSFSFSFVGS